MEVEGAFGQGEWRLPRQGQGVTLDAEMLHASLPCRRARLHANRVPEPETSAGGGTIGGRSVFETWVMGESLEGVYFTTL